MGTEISAENFRIDILATEAGLIIALAGEFDIAGVPRFEQAVDMVCDGEPARVLLDFTELQFIDSSGIAAIVRSMGRLARDGDALRACGIRGQVERVLDLVEVLPRLELVERPRDAVAWPDA
jgi:anti-sigma B factor antagonist